MNVIVTDRGFGPDDWQGPVVVLAPDTPPESLTGALGDSESGAAPDAQEAEGVRQERDAPMVVVDFPSFADGRGFTLARLLRLRGFRGRLRARGHVLADQYTMARRAGFDEVEIDAALAQRQPQDQWRFRADWQSGDYQARLRG